jgi:hypothetical protein
MRPNSPALVAGGEAGGGGEELLGAEHVGELDPDEGVRCRCDVVGHAQHDTSRDR